MERHIYTRYGNFKISQLSINKYMRKLDAEASLKYIDQTKYFSFQIRNECEVYEIIC